ncbi:uncharacterized protein LOC110445231 [Mizuhopecten yessoensis]|uniref:uncharacterized protein LOC110445231 n=1 Tax=Mizuhopecten yessoensis TaxID=6573 RepID=UPI000B458DEA|nr:uncharacterized protein LOC110445231 [Mizuhopecten yessoensis]XP_021345409.1 uncharacterized protein LOC110445231 [Mizuhopecten yessoensis]
MLGTLSSDQKQNWKAHVTSMVHAYNCTCQESTGQSPYFLMFGRNPRLPVDLAFGIETGPNMSSMPKYVDDLRQRLLYAYDLAAKHSAQAKNRQKKHYDSRVREAVLNIGDRVLVKILAFEGKHKLTNKWEEDPYIVTGQPNADIPAYTVRKENGEGRIRTLHRNLLLPIGCIDTRQRQPIPTPRKPKPTPRKLRSRLRHGPSCDEGSTSSSSEEGEVLIVGADVQSDIDSGPTTSRVSEDEPEKLEPQQLEEELATPEDTPHITQESPVAPRGSQRNRVKPVWMRKGDFSMMQQQQKQQQQQQDPDWKLRAKFLTELIDRGTLEEQDGKIVATFLSILSGKII